jgi:hypothetical protein
MRLRRLIIATHRDVGYFFAGLTVIYAISGIAVNHIDDWNPSYVMRSEVVEVGPCPRRADHRLAGVLRRLATGGTEVGGADDAAAQDLPRPPHLTVSVPDVMGRAKSRGARSSSELPSPTGARPWTWFAEPTRPALLSCTGIFIISGTKGLGGRGRWLLLAGLAAPLAYLVWMAW